MVVYIHGTGYYRGSPNVQGLEGMALRGHVLVVTLGYRQGVLGFLTSGDAHAPGNYGLWDIRMALHWIQKDIKFFGGDPRSVTLMGQSAGGGGSLVSQIMLSKAFDGLYYRVIAQSGSAFSIGAWEVNGYSKAVQLCAALLCPPRSLPSMLNCLRDKPTNEIMAYNMHPLYAKITWGVRQDGVLFTGTPEELLQNRTAYLSKIPYLGGSIATEGHKEGRLVSQISSGKDSFLSVLRREFFDPYFAKPDVAFTTTRLEYFYPDEDMRSVLLNFFAHLKREN